MPTAPFDEVGHRRRAAEEMRFAAENMSDPVNRATALRLADEYDRLARKAADQPVKS